MNSDTIIKGLKGVTNKWAKQRKAEERQSSRSAYRRDVWSPVHITEKEVAYEIMEDAYLKASANGTLPTHARQIMYAARGEIQDRTGMTLKAHYFIQRLLPDFMNTFTKDELKEIFQDFHDFTSKFLELDLKWTQRKQVVKQTENKSRSKMQSPWG